MQHWQKLIFNKRKNCFLPTMSASYGWCNKFPKTSWLKIRDLFSDASGGQKPDTGVSGLGCGCQHFLQRLQVGPCTVLGLWPHHSNLCLGHHSSVFRALSYKHLGMHLGSIQTFESYLPISDSLITSANPILSYKCNLHRFQGLGHAIFVGYCLAYHSSIKHPNKHFHTIIQIIQQWLVFIQNWVLQEYNQKPLHTQRTRVFLF